MKMKNLITALKALARLISTMIAYVFAKLLITCVLILLIRPSAIREELTRKVKGNEP